MDPEVKREFDELRGLIRDNHRLLRAVRRHQIIETFGKWILWAVLLLGGGYFFFQYFEPLVAPLLSPGSEFQKLLHSYQTGQG